MSKSEYSFHNRQKNNRVGTMEFVAPKGNTKKIIMDQYDHFNQLKQSNERINYLSETQNKMSQEITATFNQLQKSTDVENTKQLGEKLNYLTDLHKKLKAEYDDILQKELNVLHQNWPELFEKIQEGIDRDTLEHVLTVFEEVQSGKITKNEGVINGMEYTSKKYNLPSDFFNKNAVEKFNKDINKMS